MAELFDTSKHNVSMKRYNILNECELNPISVIKDYLSTAADGKDYKVTFYSLGEKLMNPMKQTNSIWKIIQIRSINLSLLRKDKNKKMPLRHKDTKISQRFKYQYHTLSEAFEPLCLCGRRRLFGVGSNLNLE